MKLEPKVTPERVFAAANRLKDLGVPLIEITNTRIRQELGGGSMETIQPLLKEWKRRTDNPVDLEMPGEMNEELKSFGRSLWQTAARAAQTKAAQQFENYYAVVRERDQLYHEIDKSAAQINTLNDAMTNLYGDLMKLRDKLTGQCSELGVYRANQDTEDFMNLAEEQVKSVIDTVSALVDRHFRVSVSAVPEPPPSDQINGMDQTPELP